MRTWFITGASRGFGTLIAEHALRAGDAVIATARKPEDVVARLGSHPNLLAVRLDVTSEAEAHQAVAEGVKHFGRIDVLVNNAGFGVLGAVEETSANETERLFATNVFGVLNVIRAVLPHMRRQRSGHIINISSIGGYQAYMGWGVYGSTKFAVEGITEALHQEVAPLGIHATVVEPGFFRTDFLDEQSLVKTALELPDYDETVGAMRRFAKDANHAQPGNPVKFAEAILALVNAPKPPQRLPLGSDTVARIEEKNHFVASELAEWRDLALSTDFQA
ncbi:SDR family NAD(P)-dependent oxidoreductase [Pseudomonas sp. AOB-7]|jgi:NAD(P)-dependent dehydrogenase (short-subunit alcohol dehydrogenase family)|uniref:oxidoreductase n=1 Tax=unclassified Pseudomonas TaxID=196821 RepID=UPI00041D550D|nr:MULTISPECIES: oxidoreductase [unclassified Pseudomonas]RMH85989.1 SDR family NAD(P)-dependent oxidoreductase [Pseudomonas sp. AOB-7]